MMSLLVPFTKASSSRNLGKQGVCDSWRLIQMLHEVGRVSRRQFAWFRAIRGDVEECGMGVVLRHLLQEYDAIESCDYSRGSSHGPRAYRIKEEENELLRHLRFCSRETHVHVECATGRCRRRVGSEEVCHPGKKLAIVFGEQRE